MFRYFRNKLLRLYRWVRFKITGNYVIYLCGPMTSAVKDCNVWRTAVHLRYKDHNVKIINPVEEEKKKTGMDLKESITKFRGWQRSGNRDLLRKNMKRIKVIDLKAVKYSDFIIAFWDNNIPTIGTVSELDWSEEYDTPVYTFTPNKISDLNPWLFYDLIAHDNGCVVHSLPEVFSALEQDYKITKIKEC